MYLQTNLEKVRFEIEHPEATIEASQRQSERIDKLLGFQHVQIEEELVLKAPYKGQMWEQQPWIGLPIPILQTPYAELVEMVTTLNPKSGETWVDLGACYGRLGIVLWALAPETKFIGYELIPERVSEGDRIFRAHELQNAKLIAQDLAEPGFKPQAADCYFIYDFGARVAQEKTLEDLKQIATQKPIRVIARGRGCRNWIERGHPWLSEVNTPIHTHYYSIYFA